MERVNRVNRVNLIDLLTEQCPATQIDPPANTLIIGARSPETAVAVTDYPYGRRLRCIMRYWLETKRGHGTRLVAQTNNPKKPGLVWNKPHAETYSQTAVVLHTNDDGHVKARYPNSSTYDVRSVADCQKKIVAADDFERSYSAAFNDHRMKVNDTLLYPAVQLIRLSDQCADGEELPRWFDYKNQAWVVAGVYITCGHPQQDSVGVYQPCPGGSWNNGRNCYGREHTGEAPLAEITAEYGVKRSDH